LQLFKVLVVFAAPPSDLSWLAILFITMFGAISLMIAGFYRVKKQRKEAAK